MKHGKRNMADEEKSIIEYISEVDELLSVSKFVGSEMVDKALSLIVKIMHKPDINPKVATIVIVELQAISSMCAIQASYYKNLNPGKAGSEEYKLKNMYFSLHEAINELVNALKYFVK
jgi:hypothetical protein